MNILKDVLSALFSMFVADARLTATILATVALAAVLIDTTSLPPLRRRLGPAAGLHRCPVPQRQMGSQATRVLAIRFLLIVCVRSDWC